MNRRKLLQQILISPRNVKFDEFVGLVEAFGFEPDRVSGSHHIFKHAAIRELVNIQNYRGEAKPYQIRQFLRIVEKYDLHLEEQA